MDCDDTEGTASKTSHYSDAGGSVKKSSILHVQTSDEDCSPQLPLNTEDSEMYRHFDNIEDVKIEEFDNELGK